MRIGRGAVANPATLGSQVRPPTSDKDIYDVLSPRDLVFRPDLSDRNVHARHGSTFTLLSKCNKM